MNQDHEKAAYDSPPQAPREKREDDVLHRTGSKMPRREIKRVDGRRLEERRPGKDWFRQRALEARFNHSGGGELFGLSIWMRRRVLAISTCVMAEAPNGDGSIPQWHISFTNDGRRCTDEEVRQSLACFRLTGADEDNHEPGMARHYWMPLDPARRAECECKTTEKVIVEPDGHRWSTPHDDRECNGCKHAQDMASAGVYRPCTIHGKVNTAAEFARALGSHGLTSEELDVAEQRIDHARGVSVGYEVTLEQLEDGTVIQHRVPGSKMTVELLGCAKCDGTGHTLAGDPDDAVEVYCECPRGRVLKEREQNQYDDRSR